MGVPLCSGLRGLRSDGSGYIAVSPPPPAVVVLGSGSVGDAMIEAVEERGPVLSCVCSIAQAVVRRHCIYALRVQYIGRLAILAWPHPRSKR